ncbi:MAG: hypothetical protein IJR14_02065 [Synergistaceae bacterium]|nr:hypothetical protein [Synergistaceae bacterium]
MNANAFAVFDPSDVYVVFSSTQIKSATDNRGTFDAGDPDIYHQDAADGGGGQLSLFDNSGLIDWRDALRPPAFDRDDPETWGEGPRRDEALEILDELDELDRARATGHTDIDLWMEGERKDEAQDIEDQMRGIDAADLSDDMDAWAEGPRRDEAVALRALLDYEGMLHRRMDDLPQWAREAEGVRELRAELEAVNAESLTAEGEEQEALDEALGEWGEALDAEIRALLEERFEELADEEQEYLDDEHGRLLDRLKELKAEERAASEARAEELEERFEELADEASESYGQDAAQRLAPNGKPSNLDAKQHGEVRTDAFKGFFGDWETAAAVQAARDFLDNSEPVASITGNEIPQSAAPLTDRVAEYYKKTGNEVVNNKELGDVKLDRRGIRDSLGHGIGKEKIAAYALVPDVIKNGFVYMREHNWKGRGYDTAVLIANVQIGGDDYICEVVVKRSLNRQGFYLHEVEIKKGLNSAFLTVLNNGAPPKPRLIIAQYAQQGANVSKVVDANGEPLVVYRGAIEEQNIPKTSFEAGVGIFLTDNEAVAEQFTFPREYGELVTGRWNEETEEYEDIDAGPVYPLFANIRDPKIFEGQEAQHLTDDTRAQSEAIRKARQEGHDGVILRGVLEGVDDPQRGTTYIVFSPEQIKSATDNRGTFDAGDPDIYHQTYSEDEAAAMGLGEEMPAEEGGLIEGEAPDTEAAYREGEAAGRAEAEAEWRERMLDLEVKRRLQVGSERAQGQMRVDALRARLRHIADVKREVGRLVGGIGRMARSEGIIWAKQQEIRELLEGYDLMRRTDATLEKRREIESWLREDPALAGALAPEDLEYLDTMTLGEMTMDDLRGLYERVRELYEEGRREHQMWTAERQERRDRLHKDLRDSLAKTKAKTAKIRTSREDMGKQYKGVKGKLEKARDHIHAAFMSRDRFFDFLDRGKAKYRGAFVQTFVDRMSAAHGEALRRATERHKWVTEKLRDLGFKMRDFSRKATEIDGKVWTWSMIQELYLGMRNEDKANAIIWGCFVNTGAYTPEQARSIVDRLIGMLSDDMKAAAELVAQDHDANFDRINEAMIAATNKGMEKVQDYTSIHRMEHMSTEGLIDAQTADDMAKGVASAGLLRKLEDGFTKARVKMGDRNQAAIQLGLWENWHRDVSAHERAAAMLGLAGDVTSALLSRDPDGETIGKMVKERFGDEAWRTLVSFFNDDVMDGAAIAHDILGHASGFLARNMSVAYLAGNVATVIKQTASYPRFLVTAGPHRLILATAKFLTSPFKFMARVTEMSPMLKERAGSEILQAIREDPRWGQRMHQRALDILLAPIGMMDRATCAIGWQATYDANVAKLGHEGAVREADRAVRLTQPISSARDKSRIWRQQGLVRLGMMFTSDAAQTFGMTAYDLVQKLTSGELDETVRGFWSLMVLGLTAVWIKAMSEGIPWDDDEEEWGEWIADAFTEQSILSIPIVGKEALALWGTMSGKGYRSQWSSVVAPVERAARAVKLWTDEDSEEEERTRAAWLTLDAMALGGVAHLPVTGARRALKAALALREDGLGAAGRALVGWPDRER